MNIITDYLLKGALSLIIFTLFLQTVPFVKSVNGFIGEKISVEKKAAIIGEASFVVEVADTKDKRQKGLSGRESLGSGNGMLFVFPKEDTHGIWMKDMNFSIDAIWINDNFEVVHIEQNISPDSFPEVFRSRYPAKLIVELNANFVSKNNIKIGDLFTIL